MSGAENRSKDRWTLGVRLLTNQIPRAETKQRPALMLGTSADRIGTPSGQPFFATFSKNIRRETGWPVAPYLGLSYGNYDDRDRPISGFSLTLNKNFSILATYNGVNGDPLLLFSHERHVLSLILVKGRDPGMSCSITFQGECYVRGHKDGQIRAPNNCLRRIQIDYLHQSYTKDLTCANQA